MQKIIAGSLNMDASDDWMKFMPNCFKCLRASGDDLSVIEIIKLFIKGVDMRNAENTMVRQDKTRRGSAWLYRKGNRSASK